MNTCEIYAVQRLIKRFDYDGAVEIMDLLNWKDSSIYWLVSSCQRSLNFNFAAAKSLTDLVSDHYFESNHALARYRDELPLLDEGRPFEIFNELADNIIIQLEREAYTDFLGRIFQIRELLFKYAVIRFKLKEEYVLRDRIYQKRAFEHRFKLRRGLLNGMKQILKTSGGRWGNIVNVLSGRKMNELMDIRHRTIVAHGIETVTYQDISRVYDSPESVLTDLYQVFTWLEIPIQEHKYKAVNQELIAIIVELSGAVANN
ncbi:hypothetical protein BEP19_06505 [Ammoniphilus oxalaticus]|uniref:Uncharacterized protein n=1 Tax=Ammoniphilus oxalaticus TaxID=66863 RepID=A0A419SJ96_9BACL|nr:hypothetical protein [Ammoniphilus oxalaticus]RKD24055.1 hypothetical protein BEP19_06505 [Ammoniphilus oxalaticus]